jgi:hypothetical protein
MEQEYASAATPAGHPSHAGNCGRISPPAASGGLAARATSAGYFFLAATFFLDFFFGADFFAASSLLVRRMSCACARLYDWMSWNVPSALRTAYSFVPVELRSVVLVR